MGGNHRNSSRHIRVQFILYSSFAILIIFVILAFQGQVFTYAHKYLGGKSKPGPGTRIEWNTRGSVSYKHSADLWRVFTAGTLNDEQSLIREVSRVDRRLVEMCKKELVTVEDVKDLAKRCRNTLLKYLAQTKREEDSASS